MIVIRRDDFTYKYLHLPLIFLTALVAQSVDWPLWGTRGHGFNPRLQHTKVVKNGTSCSSLGTQTYWVELELVDPVQDNVTGCGVMSSVWGMILQWGSTIKVSIELPVTTRHRRDMTENCWKRLKIVESNFKPEQTNKQNWWTNWLASVAFNTPLHDDGCFKLLTNMLININNVFAMTWLIYSRNSQIMHRKYINICVKILYFNGHHVMKRMEVAKIL